MKVSVYCELFVCVCVCVFVNIPMCMLMCMRMCKCMLISMYVILFRDFRKPLRVFFTTEEAVDLGGPRREWFRSFCHGLIQWKRVGVCVCVCV